MIFTLLIILSFLAVAIREVQKIEFTPPVFIRDPILLYMYFMGFCMFVPWVFAGRIQYNYYYVPGFPFILLMASYYVFQFASMRLKTLYIVLYFFVTLYRLPFLMPI